MTNQNEMDEVEKYTKKAKEIVEDYDCYNWDDLIQDIAFSLKSAVEEVEKDLEAIEHEVAKVYCHMTNGKMSKANYVAEEVIAVMEDEQQKIIEEAVKEAVEEQIEKDAGIAEELSLGKEYKDCPAAWLTTASEKIAKQIREQERGK